MKKFLFTLLTALSITAISVQSLYGKRLENKTDYSLTSQNKEEICHVLPSDVQQNEKTLEIYSSEYTISSKR